MIICCSKKEKYTVVPVLVGSLNRDRELMYGDLFAKYLNDPSNLFVISSDFCHWGKWTLWSWCTVHDWGAQMIRGRRKWIRVKSVMKTTKSRVTYDLTLWVICSRPCKLLSDSSWSIYFTMTWPWPLFPRNEIEFIMWETICLTNGFRYQYKYNWGLFLIGKHG